MYFHFTEELGRTLLVDRLVKSEQSICHTINHSLRKKKGKGIHLCSLTHEIALVCVPVGGISNFKCNYFRIQSPNPPYMTINSP